jgi:peptidyl-prolyl cis-trans isomerase D
MLIMRFHKLIQSKIFWYIFVGLVVFTFVGMGYLQSSGGSGQTQQAYLKETVARVGGRNVSRLELNRTREKVAGPNMQQVDADRITELALQRLASLAFAEKMDIRVPLDMARQQYALQFTEEDGTLNEGLRNMIQQSLQSQGLTEDFYIDFIREEMILQQLSRLMASYSLITPYEAERWAQTQTDAFTIEHARVPADLLTNEVTVTDEALAAFFAENQGRFQLPEQRTVSYLTLQAGDFLAEATPASEEDARLRYEQQPERYSREVAAVEPAEGEESAGETPPEREPIPFEEVRQSIQQEIQLERARAVAADRAADLSIELMPARNRKAQTLQDVATAAGLEVQTAGPFRMGAMIPGISNPFAFGKAAFELDTTDLGRVSEPLSQEDQVYVMVLEEILPARLPELEEVRERVMAQAKTTEQNKQLLAAATALIPELRTAIAEGTAFAAAATAAGLEVEETVTFQPKDFRSGMPSLPPALVQEVGSKSVGEVYGPVETRIGGLQIAYLAAREPRPADTAELIPQVKNQLAARLHTQALNQRFSEQVLDPMIERLDTL